MNERSGSINSNMTSTSEQDENNEESRICMDTNINGLEDYDKLSENALNMPLESMIEIINEKEHKSISKKKAINNNINSNKGLNIRNILINQKSNNNNKIFNRVVLFPLTILNIPYTFNKTKGLSDKIINLNNKQSQNIDINFNNYNMKSNIIKFKEN